MNLHDAIMRGFDKLFPRPTQEQMEAKLLADNQQTVMECEKTIRDHRFTKHMAEAQTEAIIAWRELEKREKQNGNY